MLIQIMAYSPLRDAVLMLRGIAIIAVLYMAYQIGKKIREYKILSATTGFMIFLITFGIFHFGSGISFFYPSLSSSLLIFDLIGTVAFALGMLLFVVLSEIEINLAREKKPHMKKIKYPLSIIDGVGTSILAVISIILKISTIYLFLFAVVPFVIAIFLFTNRFNELKIIKKSNPTSWFSIGISIAGFSNFLYSELFMAFMDIYIVLTLNSFCVIIGSLMMTKGWSTLPSLQEFDWMKKINRLLVVHIKTSIPLLEYNFQAAAQVNGALAGSAIGGINMLLKEILSSKGHIKQIDHEDKKIYFTHGEHTVSILITTGASEEYKYRLELFEIDFEREYGIDALKNFDGDITPFDSSINLVKKHFG